MRPLFCRTMRCFAGTFRDKKVADCFQLLLTKKPVSFDYVAVDATALVATALRMSKHVSTEQRRRKEVARHVSQSLQQLLRKVHCRRTLLVALDGAEGLLKAHLTRSSSMTKRLESRLVRLPGTEMMQAVEERIVRGMPDRFASCNEVVVSGTRVPGNVEEKMSAWALDLACRPKHDRNVDTLTMFGPTELFLNVMGLTPYFHASNLVQHGADLRQMRWVDMLEWLELDRLAASGDSTRVARARTDALFLYLLCNGCTATDLPAVQGGNFVYLYHRYCELNDYGEGRAAGDTAPVGAKSTDLADAGPHYLFEDLPGNTLQLNLTVLHRLFQSSSMRMKEDKDGRPDSAVESYLAHALQSHSMLCLGKAPGPGLLPQYVLSPCIKTGSGTSVSTSQLMAHLRAMMQRGGGHTTRTAASFPANGVSTWCTAPHGTGTGNPSSHNGEAQEASDCDRHHEHLWSANQPLTAAEYTLLSYPQPHFIEAAVQFYLGAPPKPEVPKKITDERRPAAARATVQDILSYGNPAQPHPCLCYSPSYLWSKNEKTGVWSMAYIDVGAQSEAKEIRRCCNALVGVSMSLKEGPADGPSMFSASEQQWVCISQYPLEAASQVQGEGTAAKALPPDGAGAAASRDIRVLSWNVMFDRYSGQPTPLGMPGIDWCSPQRYPVLARCIEREDADIVGMQEVETAFAEYLLQQPWCREKYVVSCMPTSPVLDPWGILVLLRRGRFTLEQITHVNIPAWSGHVSLMPIVSISVGKRQTIDIATVHLIAPFTKANENARTGQDAALRQRAVKGLATDSIVMGDFNDWPGNEFSMPADTLYRECWPMVHPSDPGKTMDDTNTFCQLKVEEMFFGRSDKIFLRSRKLHPKAAHLVGTRSVNQENANNDAPAYLFPSDHYGVCMDFTLTSP